MLRIARFALAIAAPLMLLGCVLVPGKFVSSFDLRADRSFTFTYVGEVVANQMDGKPPHTAPGGEETPELIAQMEAIAGALSQEEGYRSVEYVGDQTFKVDYAISGRLTHNFTYPFNPEAQAILPFIAAELRRDGTVQISAPAFGNSRDRAAKGTDAKPNPTDGHFTVTTDAGIVSHNGEASGQTLRWRITPDTNTPPKAAIKLAR